MNKKKLFFNLLIIISASFFLLSCGGKKVIEKSIPPPGTQYIIGLKTYWELMSGKNLSYLYLFQSEQMAIFPCL